MRSAKAVLACYFTLVLPGGMLTSKVYGQTDLDKAPISYRTALPDNAVSRLQVPVLAFDAEHGYLHATLKALDVPVSSQVLVFSKTSLQRERISPKTPRALYFNDDVYVGFCLRGDILELSAPDANLGTVFYSLEQVEKAKPQFIRQNDNCLICHASSRNQGIPGHLVRSVYPDRQGMPIYSSGTHMTDHSSPFQQRWGGWYVTGKHGTQAHMGNWVVENKRNPEAEGNAAGQNVTELRDRFTVANYPSPHSDLIALMTLEHQTEMHNRIARAAVLTRQALHSEMELNRELKEPADKRWGSTTRRIETAGEAVVQYMFFSGEMALTEPIHGTSAFAQEFAARGPRDNQGRSLREFDLKSRMFRYPCSYLVYSKVFATLPEEAKAYIWRRAFDVLSGKDQSPAFAHLIAADRAAVLGILRDTVPDLPPYWRP